MARSPLIAAPRLLVPRLGKVNFERDLPKKQPVKCSKEFHQSVDNLQDLKKKFKIELYTDESNTIVITHEKRERSLDSRRRKLEKQGMSVKLSSRNVSARSETSRSISEVSYSSHLLENSARHRINMKNTLTPRLLNSMSRNSYSSRGPSNDASPITYIQREIISSQTHCFSLTQNFRKPEAIANMKKAKTKYSLKISHSIPCLSLQGDSSQLANVFGQASGVIAHEKMLIYFHTNGEDLEDALMMAKQLNNVLNVYQT